MLDLLRTAIEQNADTTWRVSTSRSATWARVEVDLGVGRIFRAQGASVDLAEEKAAAKIVEWAYFRRQDPDDELAAQLEASIAVERAKRGRPTLRVIKGGKS